MDLSTFLSLFIYTFITAVTPGPNNILALNAVINNNFKQAKNLILGIFAGFFCVMLSCAFASALFNEILPSLMPILKYLGVLYILYLAFKVAISKPPSDENEKTNSLSFLSGFILQFVNIKIIIYGITIFVVFVFPFYDEWQMIFVFVLFASFTGFFGTGVWIVSGAILKKFLQKYYKIVNFIMAALLVLSAVQIVFDRN